MDYTVPKYSFNHCDRKPCFWPWNLYSTRRERWRFKRKQLNKQKRRHQGVVYIFLLRWRNLNRWSIKRGKHMTRYCILAHIAFSNFTEEKKKNTESFSWFWQHAGEVYGEKSILATEARELQSRILKLSNERDKSLSIIDEVWTLTYDPSYSGFYIIQPDM